jgi:hypothetical protein
MSTATKLAGFLIGLLVVFGAAVGVGRAVGPIESATPVEHEEMAQDGTDAADPEAGEAAAETEALTTFPKGLMVSQDGYTFRLAETTVAPGAGVPIAFTIQGPDSRPVTEYDVEHEEDLHLIAVRRDFAGFQHVHPDMDADGTWRISLDLTPGDWRLFADFKAAAGNALTLGADLAVRGAYRPAPASPDSRTSNVDGYTVTLGGDLVAGEEAELSLEVSRDGEPVTDLEPYLGAYGHLVALRGGDLAYLHVHPEGVPDDGVTKPGPEVVFFAEVPSPGRYHLYLDFKHEGTVRTAAFTVTVSADGRSGSSDTGGSDSQSDDGGHSDGGSHSEDGD